MRPAAMVLITIFSLIAVPSYSRTDPNQVELVRQLIREGTFSHLWKLPEAFSPTRLERLLQQFSDQVYGRGFRYIGDRHDADHGHILFRLGENDEGEPFLEAFAILYHTQESAYTAYWNEGTPQHYSYLDAKARNWLQWLDTDPATDGLVIENARKYADPAEENIDIFYSDSPPVEDEHYTIHGRNLSFDLLGTEIVGELQFRFHRASCNQPSSFSSGTRGPISISFSGTGEVVCLMLASDSHLLGPDWFN